MENMCNKRNEADAGNAGEHLQPSPVTNPAEKGRKYPRRQLLGSLHNLKRPTVGSCNRAAKTFYGLRWVVWEGVLKYGSGGGVCKPRRSFTDNFCIFLQSPR